jgi:hypothetical protein
MFTSRISSSQAEMLREKLDEDELAVPKDAKTEMRDMEQA